MSWPQQPHDNPKEDIDQQANNLSVRAMQLSIFGSMLNNTRVHAPSFPGDQEKPSHSLSYPRFPSSKGSPLVSAKSEGSSTLGKNIDVRERKGDGPKPPAESLSTRTSRVLDYSSRESGAEDEPIVTIDSPSMLSFRQPA